MNYPKDFWFMGAIPVFSTAHINPDDLATLSRQVTKDVYVGVNGFFCYITGVLEDQDSYPVSLVQACLLIVGSDLAGDVEWARFDSAGDYIDWLPQYEH